MVKLSHCWTLLKSALLLVLLVLIFALVWLHQGPKSLNWAAPFIANRINGADSPYVISFGDVAIDWSDWSKLGLVRVSRVNFSGRDGAVFATLPEIYVSFDPLGFLPARRSLNTILIQNAKMFLTRDKEKVLRLGLESSEGAIPLSTLNLGKSDTSYRWDGRLPFRHLRLHNVRLTLADEVSGTRLVSPNARLDINRRFGRYDSSLSLPFTFGEVKGSVNATLKTVQGVNVLAAVADNMPSDYICVLGNCPEGMEITGLIDGTMKFTFDGRMQPQSAAAKFTTDKAVFTAPTFFPEPLELSQSSLEFSADQQLNRVEVQKADLVLKDTHVTGSAHAEKKEDGWYIDGTGSSDKLDIEKLYKYWPLGLASDSRTWIIGSLKSGYGVDSSIKLHLTPGDLHGDTLADEAIDATVNARNITVNYLPGFPQLHGVDGLVKFTGKTIAINGTSGTMLTGTSLSKALIVCSNLDDPATPMHIETTLSAPAADAATILALEHFSFDDALELNPATLKGTIAGTLKFDFDAFSKDRPGAKPVPDGQISFENVKYDIDTKMTDIAQPKFAGMLDIAGGSGSLQANNDGMNFDGGINVDGNDVKVKVTQKSGADVLLGLDGRIQRAQFTALGLPDDKRFGDGSLGVTASVVAKKDALTLKDATADLTDMAFRIPEISWQKKRGTAAKITLAPKGKSYALNVSARDLSVPGATLSLTPDLNLQEINLPKVATSKNDFAFSYKTTASGFDVKLTGNRLDASDAYNNPAAELNENSLLANFPPINLTLDLAQLTLMPGQPFTALKGTLNCNDKICSDANLSAKAGKSNLSLAIGRPEGARRFTLTASNAGDFLRALDVTDRMYGGTLSLKGDYDDSVSPAALPAKLAIRDFTLKNSQILARILSIGSLSGLSNALTGRGIDFEKMTANIRSHAGKITVKDGKANGNALGITVEGTVDTNKSSLNLKGVLVPAFALNTFLGKIPLIGELAGGDEGLIAFNYSVKGPYADPGVFVNPLSGFTPGFLRQIWGAGDSGSDDQPAVKDDQPKYPQ
jgi:hypothetical protein